MNLSKAIECRHCGNVSKMEILCSSIDTESDENADYEYGSKYDIIKCPAPSCRKINIASYSWHDFFTDEDFPYEVIYPQPPNKPTGLPDKISKALQAANKVKTIDANAYAILIRRLLELVCLDRNATGGTLALMLRDLANKQEIPDKLVKVASGLKDFGNIGAHAGSGELTHREIPIVTALCNAILEYVYSAPYLANLAESKLKAIKTRVKKNEKTE